MYTKMMELVNAKLRQNVDLTKYQNEITNAVQSVIPDAKVNVQARTIGKNMKIDEFANTYLYTRSETNEPAISVQRFKEKRLSKSGE